MAESRKGPSRRFTASDHLGLRFTATNDRPDERIFFVGIRLIEALGVAFGDTL